jgi:hypothetical protein
MTQINERFVRFACEKPQKEDIQLTFTNANCSRLHMTRNHAALTLVESTARMVPLTTIDLYCTNYQIFPDHKKMKQQVVEERLNWIVEAKSVKIASILAKSELTKEELTASMIYSLWQEESLVS